jgi:Spy/CpxP family protein refolding chaperone
MRQGSWRIAFAAFGLATAVSGFAQDAPAVPIRHPFLRHHIRECLAILDLTDEQRTGIDNALEAARPTIEADVAAVGAARETLIAALDVTPPDACAIGADALALKSARETLRAEREAVREQVVAILTPDQQSRFQGCLDAPWPDASSSDESAQ